MIKSNEVRIGNVIMWEGDPTKLSALHIYTMFDAQDEAEEGSPILLTREVLFKAGFEMPKYTVNSNYTTYQLIGHSFMVAEKEGTYWYLNYVDEDDHYSTYWPELKTLHQLQNLYYALHEKEIDIKL